MSDIYDKNTATKSGTDWVGDVAVPLASTAMSIGYNYYANKQNQKFNAQEAEKARQFEQEMSNTAYQRAYEDMKKAGLNPNLAGGSGGAGTPTGNPATAGGMMPINFAENMNTALVKSQIENMKASTNLTEKQAGKSEAERTYTENKTDLETDLNAAEIELKQAQTKDAKEAAKQKMQAAINQQIQNVYEAKYGRKMPANMLDHIGSRVMGVAMESGGSTTGLEYIIQDEIDKYEKSNTTKKTSENLNNRNKHYIKASIKGAIKGATGLNIPY